MTPATERATRRGALRGPAIVVVLAAVAGLLAGLAGEPRDAASASGADPDTVPIADPAATPVTVLLAHRDRTGTVDMLVLYGFPGGDVGNGLLLPPSTLVDVPSFGLQPVGDIVTLGSPALLATSIENALGVGVDHIVLLDDEQRAAVFEDAQLSVELPRTVLVEGEDQTVSWPPGMHDVDGATAISLLDGETDGGELAHQVTVRAVLEPWRASLTDPRVASGVLDAVAALAPLASRAGATLRYDTLPVDSIGLGEETRFGIRRDDAESMLRLTFEWALLNGGEPRPRVEIRNGVGAVGLTASVAELVVPAGAYVTITGNVEGFGIEQTGVTYHDEDARPAAERLARVVGTEIVVPNPAPVQIVDVTIYVGADFVPPP